MKWKWEISVLHSKVLLIDYCSSLEACFENNAPLEVIFVIWLSISLRKEKKKTTKKRSFILNLNWINLVSLLWDKILAKKRQHGTPALVTHLNLSLPKEADPGWCKSGVASPGAGRACFNLDSICGSHDYQSIGGCCGYREKKVWLFQDLSHKSALSSAGRFSKCASSWHINMTGWAGNRVSKNP